MLADDQHGVDGQLIPAAAQRLGDGRVDREAELLGPLAAQIVFGPLIDVGRDDVEGRAMPAALDRIADEKPLGHVPGVRVIAPLGGDDGQSRAVRNCLPSPDECRTQHRRPDGFEKTPSLQHQSHSCGRRCLAGTRMHGGLLNPMTATALW